MIYTVTFNPAIDYLVYVPELSVGSIIRSEKESTFCGGKGINVSLILQELGIESTATGFLAGFTGSICIAYTAELISLTLPFSTTKVTLSPQEIPSISRISFGIVIWPFDITFALSINVFASI